MVNAAQDTLLAKVIVDSPVKFIVLVRIVVAILYGDCGLLL